MIAAVLSPSSGEEGHRYNPFCIQAGPILIVGMGIG